MGLFRRKREGEDGRDERPPPPAQGPEPDEPQLRGSRESAGWESEQIEDSFAGAITATALGEIVSGLVEVRVLPAAPVPEPVVLRLEWARDEVNWKSADPGGADDQRRLGAAPRS